MNIQTTTRFIQDNYMLLKEELDTDSVVDYCFQHKEIDRNDKEEIYHEQCRSKKNGLFLDKLLGSTKQSTSKNFLEALNKYQPELLGKLRVQSPFRHPTYADAVKKPESPAAQRKFIAASKQGSSDIDKDFSIFHPCNILKHVKEIEEKLSDGVSRGEPIAIQKYLHIFKDILTFHLNNTYLSEDFFQTSNLHGILTHICKLEPLQDKSRAVNDAFVNIKLDALELMSDISRSNSLFCKNLCNKASIPLLFCVLTDYQKVWNGLRYNRLTRSKSKLYDIHSAALQVICNLVSCEMCDLGLLSDFQKSEVLKTFLNTEDEELKVTSVLIMIHLNLTSELNGTDVVKVLISWLKKVFEESSRECIRTPNAFCVVLGLTKLALVTPYSTSIKEDQYIQSLAAATDCWNIEPKAAVVFLKLLSTLNTLTPGSSRESHCRSDTVTIQLSETNLLLIGCSGAGKSSLGNSLLGKNVFSVSNCNNEPNTPNISLGTGTFNGRLLQVVDTPGVGNSFSVQKVCQAMKAAFIQSQSGFQAILLVIQYGFNKIHECDLKSIEDYRKMLGTFFLRDYGVLVFTFGDYFKNSHNIKRLSFEDWLSHQGSWFCELIAECKNRVVLFDNLTQDENRKSHQLCRLMDCVDRIRFTDYRFSGENFHRAEESRSRLIKEENDKDIHRSIEEEIKLAKGDLDKVMNNVKPEEQKCHLQKLKERTCQLKVRIDALCMKHPHDYQSLVNTVNQLITEMENQMKVAIRVNNNKKKFKKCLPKV